MMAARPRLGLVSTLANYLIISTKPLSNLHTLTLVNQFERGVIGFGVADKVSGIPLTARVEI